MSIAIYGCTSVLGTFRDLPGVSCESLSQDAWGLSHAMGLQAALRGEVGDPDRELDPGSILEPGRDGSSSSENQAFQGGTSIVTICY